MTTPGGLRVIVVGGGISGLTAAYLAKGAGHQVVCVDAGVEPGGVIRAERHEGFLCEVGPQALLDDAPDSRALIASLGLEGRAITASLEARRRFLYVRGALHLLPMSPAALLRSRLLSPLGKLRLLAEPLIPARRSSVGDDAETAEAFATRRLGREAGGTLFGTGIIGIYSADAALLSAASAFPRLAALERDHGGLLRGLLAARRAGKRPGRPLSFIDGLGELPAALGRALGPEGMSQGRVLAVEEGTTGSRWRVLVEAGSATRVMEGDAVVLAVGAEETGRLLQAVVPAAHEALCGQGANSGKGELETAPIAVCCLGFRAGAAQGIGIDLAAYGFLVARGEGQPRLLGCQYESSTFPGRAPAGGVLLRAILGGTGRGFEPDIVDKSDTQIAERAVADLRVVAGLKTRPDLVRVWKHPRAIPLPGPGHAARIATLDQALLRHPGLFVVGHGVRGVGVNESIRAATTLVHGGLAAFAKTRALT